jgi:hypothetical protein
MKRLLLGLFVSLVSCAGPGGYGPRVTPIYQYRGYGEYLPERDAKVVEQGKAAVDASRVKFLQETLPEGIELTAQTLSVKPGYNHILIGKLAFSEGRLMPKLELIARVKQVALAAGGDTAIGIFLLTDDKDYTKAQGVEAVIMKMDPRFTDGAPAAPKPPQSKI